MTLNKILTMAAIAGLALTTAGCKVSGKWEKLSTDKVIVSGADGKTVEIVDGKGSLDLFAYGSLEYAQLSDVKIKIESNGKKTYVVLPDSYKDKYLNGMTIPASDLKQDYDMGIVINSQTYDLGADVCQSCHRPTGCSITDDECQVCEDYACRRSQTDSQAVVALVKGNETLAKFTSKVKSTYDSTRIH